jgi:3-phenylpropionate/trans-cinnamate dioxygenase ferredoxin subunit
MPDTGPWRKITMKYVKAAQTSDLTTGSKKKILMEGKEILLTNIADQYYAIDNKCPHMGGSLFDGILEEGHITCPRHGSVFDVKTGRLVENGKILFLKLKVNNTKSYPVKIEGTDILIGIE